MLRIRQSLSVFSRTVGLGCFATVGLCLLMVTVDDTAAQGRVASRYPTPARLAPGCAVDGAYATNFHQFGFYQTQWRRWPSVAPQGTLAPSAGQRSPLLPPVFVPPKATREDETLPPKRDTIRDTSNDPLFDPDKDGDTPMNTDPMVDPFEDDKPGIDSDLDPVQPNDEPLPPADLPADDLTSGRLPRRILVRALQTTAIPGVGTASETRVQGPPLSPLVEPLDDAAPRPKGIEIERPRPKLLPSIDASPAADMPAIEKPLDLAHGSNLLRPPIAQPKFPEPGSAHVEAPRKPISGPYNPLRRRQPNQQISTVTSGVHHSSLQQATPRRRNPLR